MISCSSLVVVSDSPLPDLYHDISLVDARSSSIRCPYHLGYRSTSSAEKALYRDDDRGFNAFHLHYDKGLLLQPAV